MRVDLNINLRLVASTSNREVAEKQNMPIGFEDDEIKYFGKTAPKQDGDANAIRKLY
jgi:hypothetical protein